MNCGVILGTCYGPCVRRTRSLYRTSWSERSHATSETIRGARSPFGVSFPELLALDSGMKIIISDSPIKNQKSPLPLTFQYSTIPFFRLTPDASRTSLQSRNPVVRGHAVWHKLCPHSLVVVGTGNMSRSMTKRAPGVLKVSLSGAIAVRQLFAVALRSPPGNYALGRPASPARGSIIPVSIVTVPRFQSSNGPTFLQARARF
jgi:hypothetical protein